jgi:hypothetical protein
MSHIVVKPYDGAAVKGDHMSKRNLVADPLLGSRRSELGNRKAKNFAEVAEIEGGH